MSSFSPSFWKSTKPWQNDAVDSPANSQNPNPPPSPSPLYLSFNQNHANFTAGTDRGFQVFSCDPFAESMRRDLTGGGGGIGIVEMLFGSNLFALVGGGSDPQYPANKVMIWDDKQGRCIGELSFLSNIRGVRLRRDRIVIILTQKVHVYSLMNLKRLDQFETAENKGGLCDITQGPASSFVLATLGLERGQIRVEHYGALKRKLIDDAHLGRIACLALSQDGQWLATASYKGTLIRIFNAHDRTLLQELRRGVDRADIYTLAFSTTAQWLAVSSDKGTIHVFRLKTNLGSLESDDGDNVSNSNLTVATTSSSSLSFIKGILPTYFSSERSMAQFRVTEDCQYIVAFGHQKDTLIILGFDGSFYRCKFDPLNGGEMSQLEYHNFLKPEGAL